MSGDQHDLLPSVTRLLALALLLVCCVSIFIPTHTLDQVMMTTEGYLWGSSVDMSGRPLLDVAMLLQPLTLLATVLACLWALRTGRTPGPARRSRCFSGRARADAPCACSRWRLLARTDAPAVL